MRGAQRTFDQVTLDMQASHDDATGYTAAGGGVWVAPAPTTKQDAIDRLALAMSGVLAGPIP